MELFKTQKEMILEGTQVYSYKDVWVAVQPLSINSKDIASLNSTITPMVLDIELLNGYTLNLRLNDMSELIYRLPFLTVNGDSKSINILHTVGVSKVSETTSRIHLAGASYVDVLGTVDDIKARLRAFLHLILGEE